MFLKLLTQYQGKAFGLASQLIAAWVAPYTGNLKYVLCITCQPNDWLMQRFLVLQTPRKICLFGVMQGLNDRQCVLCLSTIVDGG